MSIVKKIVGAIVVLAMIIGAIWLIFKPAKSNPAMTQNEAIVTPVETDETNNEDEAFKSNMTSWMDHKRLENAAQFALATGRDKVIRTLVEENFTSYDVTKVAIAGNMIHRIGGEMAIPIVLSYASDRRVVVVENVKWWYGQYNPGAIDDRIERLEVEHDISSAQLPPNGKPESVEYAVESKKPNPLDMFKKTCGPKKARSVTGYDEEQQQQIKDQIEYAQYQIRQNQSVLNNTQHLLSTSTSKDPRVKAHRRERARELQENIQKEKEKISKLEAQLRK